MNKIFPNIKILKINELSKFAAQYLTLINVLLFAKYSHIY